ICFFFQAEDGIRDFHVTGVQTCALPIFTRLRWSSADRAALRAARAVITLGAPDEPEEVPVKKIALLMCLLTACTAAEATQASDRSEERRVGKECKARR